MGVVEVTTGREPLADWEPSPLGAVFAAAVPDAPLRLPPSPVEVLRTVTVEKLTSVGSACRGIPEGDFASTFAQYSKLFLREGDNLQHSQVAALAIGFQQIVNDVRGGNGSYADILFPDRDHRDALSRLASSGCDVTVGDWLGKRLKQMNETTLLEPVIRDIQARSSALQLRIDLSRGIALVSDPRFPDVIRSFTHWSDLPFSFMRVTAAIATVGVSKVAEFGFRIARGALTRSFFRPLSEDRMSAFLKASMEADPHLNPEERANATSVITGWRSNCRLPRYGNDVLVVGAYVAGFSDAIANLLQLGPNANTLLLLGGIVAAGSALAAKWGVSRDPFACFEGLHPSSKRAVLELPQRIESYFSAAST